MPRSWKAAPAARSTSRSTGRSSSRAARITPRTMAQGREQRPRPLAGSAVPRSLDRVSVAPTATVVLDDRFARELPELAIPWQADQAADPRLLVLNEPLATELGLDAAWLRTPDGLRLLVGNLVPAG